MRQIFSWPALTACAILLAAAYSGSGNAMNKNQAANAAFRDGLYLGKLAAERGETPQVSLGRWATASDRESFVAGYETAYQENSAKTVPSSSVANPNTDAAYRDGAYLAKLDVEQGRSAHVLSGRWVRREDKASFSAGYRQAYEEFAARLERVSAQREAALVRR
jgi:hypothetical protein